MIFLSIYYFVIFILRYPILQCFDLQAVQSVIGAFCSHQLLVRAAFNHFAAFDDDQLICVTQRGKSVRNHDGRFALDKLGQRCLDFSFGFGIHSGGRFVKNQNFGVTENCARDGDSLAFTAGKILVAEADLGVVGIGHSDDEFVCACGSCRCDDLVIGGVGTGVTDVFQNRADEQIGFLRYDCDILIKILERELFDVDPVDIDASFFGIVKTDQRFASVLLPAPV